MMNDTELIELVRRARAGDRSAFDALVQRTEAMVFAVVLRRLRNRSEALEVTQDVFIQVLRKLPQLREDERFEAWVRKIAVRLAINRAVRRPREVNGDAPALGTVRATGGNPLERIVRDMEVLRHHGFTNEQRFGSVAQVMWDAPLDYPVLLR